MEEGRSKKKVTGREAGHERELPEYRGMVEDDAGGWEGEEG